MRRIYVVGHGESGVDIVRISDCRVQKQVYPAKVIVAVCNQGVAIVIPFSAAIGLVHRNGTADFSHGLEAAAGPMKDSAATDIAQNVRFPMYEFIVLFVPVVVIALVVGASFASMRTESEIQAVLDDDNTRLQFIGGFIGAQVSNSLNHLVSISGEAAVTKVANSPDKAALQTLESTFMTFARRHPYYDQVRWIDRNGRERVRVSRSSDGPTVTPPDQLQDKHDRYYFQATQNLLPGEIYISPIDFNNEQGAVEAPLKPVLRIAKRLVGDDRESRGIIIFNIDMRPFFDAVEGVSQSNSNVLYHVVNRAGELLHRPAAGELAVTDSVVNFADMYPALWQSIRAKQVGDTEAQGGLWTWKRLQPADIFHRMKNMFPAQLGGIDQLVTDEFELTLVASRPIGFLLDIRRDNRMLVSLATLVGLSVYGLSMFLYLSGHVRERRAQLRAGYAVARAENLEKMKKLEERFHRLFEASSVGQLVVNADGNIEIGNAAAETLLGYEPGELNGESVDFLLPADQRAQHRKYRDTYMEDPEPRLMGGGRRLEAVTKSGEPISVEIGLNPYMDAGRQMVLVSIIDLSKHQSAEHERRASATG